MKHPTLAAFLLFALFGATATSAQRTLLVPSQYATIQAAIIAAKDNDTVLVAPGTYPGMRFLGKKITVKSSHGPAVTKLRASSIYDVVEFVDGETRAAVLEGFEIESTGSPQEHGNAIYCGASPTIRNNVITGWRGICVSGSPRIEHNLIHRCEVRTADLMSDGSGILVRGGSPDIVGNVITENLTIGMEDEFWSAQAIGGGICVWGGDARIIGNVITYNQAIAQSSGFATYGSYTSVGGGVYASFGTILANNLIAHNEAKTTLASGPRGNEGHTSEGGGVHGGALLVNNTIYGNKATVAHKANARGGGVYHTTRIVNCIVRENLAVAFPEIDTVPTVEYSNVKGGYPGTGNVDAPPRFVDSSNNDFHLRHDSPCRDKGTNAVANLPGVDFEGDPRIAGGTSDIGADEFFPHLYHTGAAAPGATIVVKLIGSPSNPAFWAVSPSPLMPPVALAGLTGKLRLDPGPMVVIPVGRFPASGLLSFSIRFSTAFPKIAIPTQALLGTHLSNLDWVHVN